MSTAIKLVGVADRLSRVRHLLEAVYMAAHAVDPAQERGALLQLAEETSRHLEKAERKLGRLRTKASQTGRATPAAASRTAKT